MRLFPFFALLLMITSCSDPTDPPAETADAHLWLEDVEGDEWGLTREEWEAPQEGNEGSADAAVAASWALLAAF